MVVIFEKTAYGVDCKKCIKSCSEIKVVVHITIIVVVQNAEINQSLSSTVACIHVQLYGILYTELFMYVLMLCTFVLRLLLYRLEQITGLGMLYF